MTGLAILNVGAGDTKLSFDKSKPVERERAARIVTDMLKRGYAILVEVGKKNGKPLYQSATGFDPKTCEYLVVGLPPEIELDIAEATGLDRPIKNKARGGRPKSIRVRRRVPADRTPAVGVARSAGG